MTTKRSDQSRKKDYHKYKHHEIHQSTEELTGTKIQYGSASYSLLCYAAMKSRFKEKTFSISDAMYVLSGRLDSSSDTKRKINVLIKQNCVEEVSSGRWQITDFGLKTRKIFGWYGNTLTVFQLEKRKADKRKSPLSWEDEV